MATDSHPLQNVLISFESGHYKSLTNSEWKGDSVWGHFKKADGGMLHVNKDKVEYIETFKIPDKTPDNSLVIAAREAQLRDTLLAQQSKENKEPVKFK